jgi:hypothetical protein
MIIHKPLSTRTGALAGKPRPVGKPLFFHNPYTIAFKGFYEGIGRVIPVILVFRRAVTITNLLIIITTARAAVDGGYGG